MMEQSHSRERHRHAELVARGNNEVIADGAAGLSDIADAGALCSLDIIGEREERVGAEGNARNGCKIRLLFFM